MNHELRLVEQYMVNLALKVRHHPLTEADSLETIHYLEHLYTKLAELGKTLGFDLSYLPAIKFDKQYVKLDSKRVLLRLTELLYLTLNLYHALGYGRFASLAFNEVHNSNLTKIWPDGKVHRDTDGMLRPPPQYVAPDMTKVLDHYSPPLFADHKALPEVTHLD